MMSAFFFILGFLSTLQIFKYQIIGVNIYPFDLVYYIIILILSINFIRNKKIEFKSFSAYGKTVFILFLVYYLFSVNLFSPIFDGANSDYLMVAIKFFIKKIIFLLFFFLIYYSSTEIRVKFINNFLFGFFISVLFHSIYSYLTSWFWYFRHVDIHSNWLSLIGITKITAGHDLINFIYYPVLRVTGFHWDPAYFGLWGIIGLFYVLLKPLKFSLKLLLLLVIIIPWILTFSRSAVFALIVVIIILIFIMIRTKKPIKHLFNPINFKSMLLLCFLIIPLMVIMPVSDKFSTKEIIESRLQVEEDIHTQKHIQYPLMAVKALMKNPYNYFFGYGNRNSGRVVEEDVIAIQDDFENSKAYDIESDISRIPINTGILGFSAYLLFISVILYNLIREYLRTKNEVHLFVFIAICSTFFAGFFYAYNDSIWVWMFWAIAIVLLQNDKIGNKSENVQV